MIPATKKEPRRSLNFRTQAFIILLSHFKDLKKKCHIHAMKFRYSFNAYFYRNQRKKSQMSTDEAAVTQRDPYR